MNQLAVILLIICLIGIIYLFTNSIANLISIIRSYKNKSQMPPLASQIAVDKICEEIKHNTLKK